MSDISKDTGKKMNNGNGAVKNLNEERENERLRKLLQRAVRSEKAPENLRERIAKMIRE